MRSHACVVLFFALLAICGSVTAQTAKNLTEEGSVVLPPVPPNEAPLAGLVSDLWVDRGFAYVGRYIDPPRRVEVFDVGTDPTSPTFVCQTLETDELDVSVEDVVVEQGFLFVAQEDSGADIDGIRIHDLVDPANPSCTGATTFAPSVPSAHNLFFHTIQGVRRLFAASRVVPGDNGGVWILNASAPGSPALGTKWVQPAGVPYCALGSPTCSPHDMSVRFVDLPDPLPDMEIMSVAALNDGVYLVDVTNPPAFPNPPPTLAHFGYTWSTPDLDGDTAPDDCDFNQDRIPDGFFGGQHFTHDAHITPDGRYLWTTDEQRCGGHILIWDLVEVIETCGPPDFCTVDEISPVGEFRVMTPLPHTVHQVRFDGSFAYVSWYQEGVRVLDISDPTDPVEVAFFDTLVPNTDDCVDNGDPDCSEGTLTRVFNPEIYGAWGVFKDACFLYASDRGTPDNNEAPGLVGKEGELFVLRYEGGPLPAQPLRISKDPIVGGDLLASWGDVPFAGCFNLYRGTFGGAWSYDHDQILDQTNLCGLRVPTARIEDEFFPFGAQPNYYYLVTSRNRCDGVEGNFGLASDGTLRPPAATVCAPSVCP